MKQVIIVVPLFLLLLAILYFFIPVFPDRVSHESFISGDAHIVITQYDLQDRIAELGSSPLGLTIADLRYEVVGREMGMSDDEIRRFLKLKDDIKKNYQNPLVQMLVGKEVSIALLPFSDQEALDFAQQITDHLLVISRPSQNARLMDVATWAISSDERIATVRYGTHTITRFNLEDARRLSVARVRDLVVMSLNEKVLRQSLDLYDGDRQGLRESEEYQSKIDHFDGASFVGYFNFAGLPDLVNQAIQESPSDNERLLLIDKEKIEAYQSAIFGAWSEENTIIDKAVISFDPKLLDEQPNSKVLSKAGLPQSFKRVSQDTIIYHWSNQFSPKTILGMLGQDPSLSDATETQFVGELSKITGLTADQLFDLFDNDLTLAVRGINEDQLVPMPRFLLSVKSEDVETLKKVVDGLIDHYSIPVRRTSLGDTNIISWGGIIGIGSILPTLSFTDDSAIISSNRQQIKNYVAPNGIQSLADLESFQAMSTTLLKPSHSFTYVDFAQTADMLQEMVSWGGTMLAIKDRELARKSKVLIDDLINPLLEGLSMYSIIGSRKYLEGNTIILESITKLDNGNQ
jgi:hypothetical protein